ncbi:MAG: VTT domain-containing protein [Fimbriimonadaceae bacterium]|nr:VTT domain-containing protein [Fimbriimonadaceae bacterium]
MHLDTRLGEVVRHYGVWAYAILFLATFAKSGLIYVPLIPTTTLAFTAGFLCSPMVNGMELVWVALTILVAAWLGDIANFGWGYWLGPKIAKSRFAKWVRLDWIDRAETAYQRHGLQIFLVARWVSVFRSTVPFVAGSSRMNFASFLGVTFVSCLLWMGALVGAGYGLGHNPWVKEHLSSISGGVLLVLLVPLVVSLWRERSRRRDQAIEPDNQDVATDGT